MNACRWSTKCEWRRWLPAVIGSIASTCTQGPTRQWWNSQSGFGWTTKMCVVGFSTCVTYSDFFLGHASFSMFGFDEVMEHECNVNQWKNGDKQNVVVILNVVSILKSECVWVGSMNAYSSNHVVVVSTMGIYNEFNSTNTVTHRRTKHCTQANKRRTCWTSTRRRWIRVELRWTRIGPTHRRCACISKTTNNDSQPGSKHTKHD